VGRDHLLGRGHDPVAMLTPRDVLPHRPARRLLHRNALRLSALTQSSSFFLSEAQRHRHDAGIKLVSMAGL
jgi:hypothetical protein